MKKTQKKKGFSLIELIIVISVIAAIAAVIVPQMGNFSSAAQEATDDRNIQTWNQVYLNAVSINAGGAAPVAGAMPSTMADGTTAPEIDVTFSIGTDNVRFYAPSFNSTATMTWDVKTGFDK